MNTPGTALVVAVLRRGRLAFEADIRSPQWRYRALRECGARLRSAGRQPIRVVVVGFDGRVEVIEGPQVFLETGVEAVS